MNTQLKEVAKVWPNIQSVFSVPHNEKDYNNLVKLIWSNKNGHLVKLL